ncbi:MAG TPA: PqqD family protein [Methanobacteriaceae archaeon]|nr:PqqD family protein [Methanobacteriaceae archaeon]
MENENMENRKITISSRVEVAQEVVSCDQAGEDPIFNMKDGVYYGLDPVGASIWNQILKPAVLVDVRDQILHEYDVEEECQSDLLELVEQLVEVLG